jgi:hypothetical protein
MRLRIAVQQQQRRPGATDAQANLTVRHVDPAERKTLEKPCSLDHG